MAKSRPVTVDILKHLVVLNALSEEHLQTLAKTVVMEEFPAGHVLFKRGDHDRQAVYLLRGKVELRGEKEVERVISWGTPETKHPIVHHQPREYTATATETIVVVRIDSDVVDKMITWDQSKNYVVEDLAHEDEEGEDDWMTTLLQTKELHRIPPANIQAMFIRMEEVTHAAGDTVIRQGEEGDYYYIIKQGKCRVTRHTRSKPEGALLANLGAGDTFGEEALISDQKRNATVTMLTDGVLMRLAKDDFKKLLNKPMLDMIEYRDAVEKVAEGAIWLDVRMPSEYENSHLAGSVNVPFYLLRNKVSQLPEDKSYIVCCDTGSRSSAVAYLLTERGYDAVVLKNGLVSANREHAA